MEKSLTIGKLAGRAGVGVETVRFYERQGLLAEPDRRASGYRQYDEGVVARLRFIRRAKELGFTLKEVAELLALRHDPEATRSDVRERVRAKVEDIEAKARDLVRIKGVLLGLEESCHGHGPADDCPILRAIDPPAEDQEAFRAEATPDGESSVETGQSSGRTRRQNR